MRWGRGWLGALLLIAACRPMPAQVTGPGPATVDARIRLGVHAEAERRVQELIPAWSAADVAAIELWETGPDHRLTEQSTRSLTVPSTAFGRPVLIRNLAAGRRYYFVGRAMNAAGAPMSDDRDRNHHLDLYFGDPALGGLDNEQIFALSLTLTTPFLADFVGFGVIGYAGLVGTVERTVARLRDRSNPYNPMVSVDIPMPATGTGYQRHRIDFGNVAPNTIYKVDYVVSCKDGAGVPYWTMLRGMNRMTTTTESTYSVTLSGSVATGRVAFVELGAAADGRLSRVTVRNMTPYAYNLANFLLVAVTPAGTASYKFPSTGVTLAYKATTSVTVAEFPGLAEAAELALLKPGTSTNPAQIGDPNEVEYVGLAPVNGISYSEPAMYTGIWPANNERIGPLTATRSLNPLAYTTPLFGADAWRVSP